MAKSPVDNFMRDNSMLETTIFTHYDAERIYDKISSYGATMTGWDDILLTLTERNQSKLRLKTF